MKFVGWLAKSRGKKSRRRKLRVCGCEVASLRLGQDNVGEQVDRRGSPGFSRARGTV